MIEIGKQIVRLNDLAPGVQSWSKYSWALRYDDRIVLHHALTSDTFILSSAQARSFHFSRRELRILRKQRMIVSTPKDDERLVKSIQQKVTQSRPITTLFLILTDQCNLDCTYCYEHLNLYSLRRSMTVETARSTIQRFIVDCPRAASIFFYGGEPMLREAVIRNAVTFVRHTLGRSDIALEVITNGTVYRDDFVPFLAQHRVGIAVSLDGPEEITNRTRVAKSPKVNVFRRAVQLIHACRQAGVDPSILCTISPDNAQKLNEVSLFFLDDLKTTNLTFNLQIRKPLAAIEGNDSYWHQLGKDVAAVYFQLLDRNIIEARTLRYISGLTEGTYSVSECDAGYGTQIVVDPDGRVGPCQGFLFDPSYFVEADQWASLPEHPLWRRFSGHTPINVPACANCPFLGTCGGGCHYNRCAFDRPNLNFCQYLRSLLYSIINHLASREEQKGG